MKNRLGMTLLMGAAVGIAGCSGAGSTVPPPLETGRTSAALTATLSVCASGCDFTSIQDAIAAANPLGGDTINVGAGLYAEAHNFTIDRPVTLLGAGASLTPVEGGRAGGETQLVSSRPGAAAIVHVLANDVTIRGFEFADGQNSIDVPVPSGVTRTGLVFSYNWIHTTQLRRGIVFNNGTSEAINGVLIDHNLMTASASFGGLHNRTLIEFGGDSTLANVVVSNNVFRNEASKGRFLAHSGHPESYLIDALAIRNNVVDAGSFNLGNIAGGTVEGNTFHAGGTIGIAGGAVLANTFLDGAYLSLWGTRRGFTRPSRELAIEDNAFGLDSALWLDEPGLDLATLSFAGNGFTTPSCTPDPATQSCYLVYGPGTCHAKLNATTNAWNGGAAPDAAYFFGWHRTFTTPWITGLAYTGVTSFAFPAPIPLEATLAVSDASFPSTRVAFFVDGSFVGSALAGADGRAIFEWTAPAVGHYSVVAFSGLAAGPVDLDVHEATTATSLDFTGPWLDADGDGFTALTATLTSAASGCAQDKSLAFSVQDTSGEVFAGSATTDVEGHAALAWPHEVLLEGAFDVVVTFAGDALCATSTTTGALSIAQPGAWARGAGKYEPAGAPGTRARFAFVAKRTYDSTLGTYAFAGRLVWVHKENTKLKSTTITGVSAPRVVTDLGTCTDIAGTGTLSTWDPTAAAWSSPTDTSFVATACEGASSGHHHHHGHGDPDAFGMNLPQLSAPGESPPMTLADGSIKLH